MLLEHSREMALISESGLQRYFGNAAVVYRKQLPTTPHTESTDVFSKRAIEMLRESPAQMHWVDTNFCSHVGECPLLLKRLVHVIQERAQPLWPGDGPLPKNIEVSTHEIQKYRFDDHRRVVVCMSKLALKSDR